MFNWDDFRVLARYLVDNAPGTGAEEAAQRSAISRAYYATFCQICDWAESQLVAPYRRQKTGADHGGVREWLRDRKQVAMATAAQNLAQLHDWRKQCDYDGALNIQDPLPFACQDALRKAEQTLRGVGLIP